MIKTRRIQGATIIEFLVGTVIMLMCLAILSPMIRTTGQVWNQTNADVSNKELLERAVLKLSPILRNTLHVDLTRTTATKLTVIVPKIDPVSGAYLYPLQDGDTYSFYLSDLTGSISKSGSILWLSKNGRADTGWSLRSGKGAIDFGSSNLRFTFDTPADPEVVTITASSSQALKNKMVTASVSSSILLRNHKISGL